MESRVDKAVEQEALVLEFIEEHQLFLEEDDLSYSVLCRMYVQGAELLKSLSNDLLQRKDPTIKAVELLVAAIDDPHCSAGTIRKREKEYERLLGEFNGVKVVHDLLEHFVDETKTRLDAAYEENGTPKKSAESPLVVTDEATPKVLPQLPWWKRLLGVHQEASSEPRESTLTPSQADSDREDYEKILIWYEQNLEVLEKAVAGRQRGEPGDWQQVINELRGRMNWCDRNMDAIEQRNAEIAGSGLVTKRRNLFAWYSEISS